MGEVNVIAGVDEAGRGALAGPVVAGACILQDVAIPDCITDSKKLTPEQREEAYAWITENCFWGVGVVKASVIDAQGILEANEQAMNKAVQELATQKEPTYLLVDGRDAFWFDYPHSSVIRGDEKEACISAASIVAKVTRDRLMISYDKEFPGFGFAQHKGYGTELHFAAIKKRGECSLHRSSFLRKSKEQLLLTK